MTDTGTRTDQILKILRGAQAGTEVSLSPGEYTLGSGADDDIHFVDLSLEARHARLRVSSGKIELAGGTGSLKTAGGLEIGAGDSTWREVEPLDIISIGMVRFALGSPTAQWTSLADTEPMYDSADPATKQKSGETRNSRIAAVVAQRWRQLSPPALGLTLLTGFALWYVILNDPNSAAENDRAETPGLELVRATLNRFDFGRNIILREEVDGTLFATGYVKSLVQRRAIVNAIEDASVPVRLRIWVLGIIENDIRSLIGERGLDITYELDSDGNLFLGGIVLDSARVEGLERLLKDQILGLNSVNNRIKTAQTFLEEVVALAKLSQIENTVTFRLDNQVIEANGTMMAEKVDLWVGFLQSYSTKYAQHLPLRSFVQMLDEKGVMVGQDNGSDKLAAIVVGGSTAGDDALLDIEKLRRGQYDMGDIFVGNPDKPHRKGTDKPFGVEEDGSPQDDDPTSQTTAVEPPTTLMESPAATVDVAYNYRLSEDASEAISLWQGTASKEKETDGETSELGLAINLLANRWATTRYGHAEPSQVKEMMGEFLPLLEDRPTEGDSCWADVRLSRSNLAPVLFWLDILGMSRKFTLSTFGPVNRRLILEAALNPSKTVNCAKSAAHAQDFDVGEVSQYLEQSRRNKAAVRFVVRDLPQYEIEVSGVKLSGMRYLQTTEGEKFLEGASPSNTSNILHIGELGIIVRQVGGVAVKIYNEELSWLIDR